MLYCYIYTMIMIASIACVKKQSNFLVCETKFERDFNYQYLSVNYTGGKTLTLQIWSIHQIHIRHGIV